MDFLSTIINQKRRRVETARRSVSPEVIELMARKARETAGPHVLASAIRADGQMNIIAEFKRKSPSRGEIRPNADPAVIANDYEAAGAAAISVLTEEDYFAGSLDDLRAVRQATRLPILRKDFIVEEYQVYESAAAGADALLLIVAALDDKTLIGLRRLCEDELGMDALVEVHTREEMDRAVSSGAQLIGVNNRNLSTLEVSLETSAELAPPGLDNGVLISESGIQSADDIRFLYGLGYRGFLIGESLMRAEDPITELRKFTQSRQGAKNDGAVSEFKL
ncbi:MAG: indole-3-glycerol phosphate synthase [Blastocatellia bacterium]|jgi:indole-3-glycerol phosphate synthase|nr:indole-3-glycerol phosphate synthase [Blastocatellia bacterium]